MRNFAAAVLLIAVNLGVRGDAPIAPDSRGPVAGSGSQTAHRSYSTDFPLDEPLVAEGGRWECGRSVGLDWADVETVAGMAYGLESGTTGFDDSVALLKGSWGPDQTVQATVRSRRQNGNLSQEVELRLRSSLFPHMATGYEINFRCLKTKDAYSEIVRWNGPIAKFSYILHKGGAEYGVSDGDVVKATIVGSVITVYKNGVQMLQATDGTYTSGHPGIGFFLQGTPGSNRDYGFSHFEASDRP